MKFRFQILEAAPEVSKGNTSLIFTRYDDRNTTSALNFSFGIDYVNWTIPMVTLETEGNYTLKTRNYVGSSTGDVYLDVKSKYNYTNKCLPNILPLCVMFCVYNKLSKVVQFISTWYQMVVISAILQDLM